MTRRTQGSPLEVSSLAVLGRPELGAAGEVSARCVLGPCPTSGLREGSGVLSDLSQQPLSDSCTGRRLMRQHIRPPGMIQMPAAGGWPVCAMRGGWGGWV